MAIPSVDHNAGVWSESSSATMRCASPSVSSQAPKRRKRDLDPSERTRRRDEDEVDDAFDPGDDSDLGLDADEEDDGIGLDTAVGFEDSADDLELPDDGEDQRWSIDSEEAGDLPGADADLFGGEEYGWLGDDEPLDDDETFDPEIADDDGEGRDDGGAEGLEDDSELDDLDLGELPEIDADVEDEAAVATTEVFDELTGMSLIDEPSIEIAQGELWKLLPTRSSRVTRISGLSAAPRVLVASGSALFVCADALYTVSGDAATLERLPLPAAAPSALAVAELDGALHLAVVAAGRIFISRDAGASFELRETNANVAQLAYTRSAAGLRLWWRTVRGALLSDPQLGPSKSPLYDDLDGELVALHGDGRRSLVALQRRQTRLQLISSTDAGKHFSRQPAPPMAAKATATLQICRDALLLADESEARCALPPKGFEPVATCARAPAALSDDEDEAFVYACVPRGDELLIVRRAVRAHGSAPLVLAVLGRELIHAPRLLAASYSEGGAASVYLASDTTLLRIEVSLDGEELA